MPQFAHLERGSLLNCSNVLLECFLLEFIVNETQVARYRCVDAWLLRSPTALNCWKLSWVAQHLSNCLHAITNNFRALYQGFSLTWQGFAFAREAGKHSTSRFNRFPGNFHPSLEPAEPLSNGELPGLCLQTRVSTKLVSLQRPIVFWL